MNIWIKCFNIKDTTGIFRGGKQLTYRPFKTKFQVGLPKRQLCPKYLIQRHLKKCFQNLNCFSLRFFFALRFPSLFLFFITMPLVTKYWNRLLSWRHTCQGHPSWAWSRWASCTSPFRWSPSRLWYNYCTWWSCRRGNRRWRGAACRPVEGRTGSRSWSRRWQRDRWRAHLKHPIKRE